MGITCHTNAASRRLPHDLSSAALTDEGSGTECFVVAVNDTPEGYGYPPEVRFEIAEQDLRGYWRAADFLNFTNADVVGCSTNLAFMAERLAAISSRCCDG